MGRPSGCVWIGLVPVLLSFICMLASFLTFMYPSPLISSQWASFGCSTWPPPKYTQIHGRPFRHFACCVTSCDFAQPPLLFFVITTLIPVALPLGSLWPVGQGMSCSTLSRSRTRGLKKGSSRSSFGLRRRPFSLTEQVGLGSPCIELPSLRILSLGRGRRRVRRRWRFSPSSMHSQGSFLVDR